MALISNIEWHCPKCRKVRNYLVIAHIEDTYAVELRCDHCRSGKTQILRMPESKFIDFSTRIEKMRAVGE